MPDEQNITHDYIIDFVRGALQKSDGILSELEGYASQNAVPIVQKEVAAFLRVMCGAFCPAKILEIGTAIGYSAILMADSAPGAKITTIEHSADMAVLARKNFSAVGLDDRIELLEGDAEALLHVLDGRYDMIFMDAAKAHYIYFLEHCLRLLKPGGLLISDNILYGGMVANRELLIRRKITIVKRLKMYIKEICNNPILDTSILSIGDGVAVSCKKAKGDYID